MQRRVCSCSTAIQVIVVTSSICATFQFSMRRATRRDMTKERQSIITFHGNYNRDEVSIMGGRGDEKKTKKSATERRSKGGLIEFR